MKAKAYNYKGYTRYKVKMKLTSKGKWRLKAYAPADSKHAATWAKKYDIGDGEVGGNHELFRLVSFRHGRLDGDGGAARRCCRYGG